MVDLFYAIVQCGSGELSVLWNESSDSGECS